MIIGKRVLALIPARGGSKGIKDKNIYPLCGKPLLAYSVEAGKQSRYIDRVLVSTDSPRIAEEAQRYGADVPFLRPERYAQDSSKTIEAVLHTVRWLEREDERYDILVLLQPTQPLRTSEDIDRALELYIRSGEIPVVSVSEVKDHPLLVRTVGADGMLEHLLDRPSTIRRQDMPVFYRVNGGIYINRIAELTEDTSFNDNPCPYIMERDRSVDIDDLADMALAEYLIASHMKEF